MKIEYPPRDRKGLAGANFRKKIILCRLETARRSPAFRSRGAWRVGKPALLFETCATFVVLMKKMQLKTALIFLFFLVSTGGGISQTGEPPRPTLESPYNTLLVHLYYLQPENYRPEIAARTFNVTDTVLAEQLAVQLKQIYDGKGLYVHLNLVPQDPNYRDSVSHQPFYTPFPKRLPEVYLEKVDDKWYYSQQTARAIPELHKAMYPFGTDFLVNLFPGGSPRQILGLAGWQWAGIVLLFLLAWVVQFVLSRLFRPVVRWLARTRFTQPLTDKDKLWKVARLGSYVVLLWLLKSAVPLLQLPVRANVFLLDGLEIAMVLLGVWLALSIADVIMEQAQRYARSTQHKLDEQLIPILRRMLQIGIVISGIVYLLQLLNVNITALIAGVSIGGLALALAAQDTVKNLIGSAMIFFDQPFQIGDWIVSGSNEGEVVEVGFRSTRIQAVDSSIISVPNNDIATAAVKNMGIRRYRLMKTTLGLTYDTPPVLLEKFIAGLRRIIEEHPKTRKDNYLVHFTTFGDSALQIYFRTHLLATTFAEELQLKEELALRILRLAEVLGVRFAFPTQTLFIEEMPGKTSLTPTYEKDPEKLDKRLEHFFRRK